MTSAYTDDRTRITATTWPMWATLGVGLAAVLTAIGTFFDITGNDSETTDNLGVIYLVTLAIILVAAAVVFGLVVRTASGRGAGTRSIVLGVLGVLTLAVFWTGVPCVLAAGAAACATASRSADPGSSLRAKLGMTLAAFTVVAAIVAAIVG